MASLSRSHKSTSSLLQAARKGAREETFDLMEYVDSKVNGGVVEAFGESRMLAGQQSQTTDISDL